MSGRLLFLNNTVGTPKAISNPPEGHRIDIQDQYALPPSALTGIDALLLGQLLDEYHLSGFHAVPDGFLEGGGAIAVMDSVAHPFLAALSPHRAAGVGGREGWALEIAANHPLVNGVDAQDLTYRKGVVGFWARGKIAPHPDAIVLTRFAATGAAADWVWVNERGGKLFVHPGNGVWGYVGEPNTSARVFLQLLDWMAA